MKTVKNFAFIAGTLMFLLSLSCKSGFRERWVLEEAPAYFTARFETTQGDFEIESRKEWSPQAVNRLYQLIKNGYYEDIAIFRVVPDFVAQFGIHNDSAVSSSWKRFKISDEPVLESNLKGTLSFARAGKDTRGVQLYINLKDNIRLDTISGNGVTGFPVVARITSGFGTVEKFYDGYGAELGTKQDSITRYGNTYLRKNYPKLDYIKKAYLIKEN